MQINGKTYTLWPQFVEHKAQWIGGTLEELPGMGPGAVTKIKDIDFRPNGTESALFEIVGVDFECGADVRYLAVDSAIGGGGWIGFSSQIGPFLHQFRIRPREDTELAADIELDRLREIRAFGA